jgi:hypothetical protein
LAVEGVPLETEDVELVHPDDDEVPGRVGVQAGRGLVPEITGGVAVDPELRSLRRPRGVEALHEHAVGVGPVLVEALPCDHEVPKVVGGDGRQVLAIGRVGVDRERGTERRSGDVEAPAQDADAAPVGAVAVPHDHEAAVGVGGDGGSVWAARVRRHQEVVPQRDAIGAEAPAEHAFVGAPDHHEVAVGIGRDGRGVLGTRRVGVDQELVADRVLGERRRRSGDETSAGEQKPFHLHPFEAGTFARNLMPPEVHPVPSHEQSDFRDGTRHRAVGRRRAAFG